MCDISFPNLLALCYNFTSSVKALRQNHPQPASTPSQNTTNWKYTYTEFTFMVHE